MSKQHKTGAGMELPEIQPSTSAIEAGKGAMGMANVIEPVAGNVVVFADAGPFHIVVVSNGRDWCIPPWGNNQA